MARRTLRIRPWRSGDEAAFELRADFAQDRAANGWDWSKGPPGPTWTLLRGDEIVGVGGCYEGENKAWWAWAQLAALERRDWPGAVRLTARVLDHVEQKLGARWIWAQARDDSGGAKRVLERLKFEPHDVDYIAAVQAHVASFVRGL